MTTRLRREGEVTELQGALSRLRAARTLLANARIHPLDKVLSASVLRAIHSAYAVEREVCRLLGVAIDGRRERRTRRAA